VWSMFHILSAGERTTFNENLPALSVLGMADLLSQSAIDRRGQDRQLLSNPLIPQKWGYHLASQPREATLYLDYYDAKIDVLDLGRAT